MPKDASTDVFVLALDSLQIPTDPRIRKVDQNWPVENPFVRTIWERIYVRKLVQELKANVLFSPGGIVSAVLPLGCKCVTMFQNMIPFDSVQRRKYPLGYMRVRHWLLKREMLRSMAKADLVICGSEFARQVLENDAPNLSGKTIVIPNGVEPSFRSNRVSRPKWLPTKGYILYVSFLGVYKAQLEVVRAYALLKRRRPTSEKLILAGPECSYYAQKVRDEIDRLNLRDDVLLIGSVPHDNLPFFYQNALINIFASECENCPNILLEALASGRPLLASNRPPMPELAGDGAIYFDPSSPQELTDKLISIIDDPVRLLELSVKARERSQLYDGARTARITWDVIGELAIRHTIDPN